MNANEIVKALHVLCGFDGKSCSGNCAACPADQFRKEHPSGACDEGTMTAAFALIESQAAKIAELNDFQNSQCAILLAKLNEAERRERAAVEYCKSPHYGDGDYYCGIDSACQGVLDILRGPVAGEAPNE